MSATPQETLDVDGAVRRSVLERRPDAPARALLSGLPYDPALLRAIPDEVIARDYGCGDPSRYLRPGETVLDLGSGSGTICFIASQVVGPSGSVIGVDMNPDMLCLARQSAPAVAEHIGYANVRFGKGRIQDLALDLERLDTFLQMDPVRSGADLERLYTEMARLHALNSRWWPAPRSMW